MRLIDALRRRLVAGERPLRFLLAGAVNTTFGFAIFPALAWSSDWLHRNYMVTLALAYAVSIAFAFVTYRVAFRGGETNARQVGVFTSVYLFQFAANTAALPLLVELGGLSPVVAQVGFAAVLMIVTYFWHSRLTFPANTGAPT